MGFPPLSSITRLRAWTMGFSGPVVYWYFSIFYVSLATNFLRNVMEVFLPIVALMLFEVWGVILNDYFDRGVDIAAGKSGDKRGHGLSTVQTVILVGLLQAVSIYIVFVTVTIVGMDPIYVALWVLAYFLGVFYSCPPLRFKTKGVIGLFVNSMVERPIPVLIFFSFSGYYGVEMILFALFTELIWTIFKHQRLDYKGDAVAKIKTAAVAFGEKVSNVLVNVLINPLSVISVLAMLAITFFTLEATRLLISLTFGLTVVGIIALILLERKGVLSPDPYILDPPYIVYLQFSYMAFALPSLAVPIMLSQPTFIPLILLYVFSVYRYVKYCISLIPGVVRHIMEGRGR
jgi:1,4-dihydroxy-2-naphthoate octaprenyltransferase